MPLDAAPESSVHGGSPERFGYSWAIFHEILPEHQEQFRRWTSSLPRSAWQGATFIDCGCGMGRNSHWAMVEGAIGGIALDVDDRSLAAARANLRRHPTIEVRRESIYAITEQNYADIAFSVGVIHHLENPDAAIARMTRAVKPGGRVLIWCYGRENMGWLVHLFDPIRRIVFSRMPLGVVYHLSLYPSVLLWLGLRLGAFRLAYYGLLRRFTFRHLRAIVFDQMVPRIAHYWRRETVEKLLTDAGLQDVTVVPVNDMSWSASGRKAPLT